MNWILLVDGMAVAYRAFFAIPALSAPDGQATNALFGFARMVLQMQKQWRPSHTAVVFDGGLPAERMIACPEYKAQRAAMPDALRSQFSLIEEWMDASGLPGLRLEQEEADDVIGTLAVRAMQESDAGVLIATSDKDLYQLVTDRIRMIPPTKATASIGPEDVLARTGVPPALIPDWLALTGDVADNIPGIPGIGPKTAAKLLSRFGSLASLYARLPELESDRLRDLLVTHRVRAERNLGMMALRLDLPCRTPWGSAEEHPPEVGRLRALYKRLNLHSLLQELGEPTLFG